ncbi:hypothetical protein BRADI_1g03672v3 [Brachypodium distachyon]|uniref:Rx N-terminal domain-containing protein n=1 Tax=Brachypodium distachyon TaxID=15368 RepID=A0A2K2DHZ0_BRADI|nr:hypothetical protein BRADI_1g03672v3 [Brachypodium distachyon]
MAGQVGSAVVSEITSRVVSKVLGIVNMQAAVNEKLRKLEMLCIKINSTVEASKKHRITGTYLLKWQEKLREAGTEGDEVLFGFRWRALNEASKSINNKIGTRRGQTYTKIAGSSIENYFRNASKMPLLSNNEEVQKLNSTVEMLEKLSADNEEFVRLVELEVLMGKERAPSKGKKPELVELEGLTGKDHAPAKGTKPEMLEKLSADNDKSSRLVELEILMGEEHGPRKGKKPVIISDHPLLQKEAQQRSNRKMALDSTK